MTTAPTQPVSRPVAPGAERVAVGPGPAGRGDQAEVARYSQIFRVLFFVCSTAWLSYIYFSHAAWVWNPLGVLLVTALGGVYIVCMEVIYRLVLRLGDPARVRRFVVVRLVIDSLFITAGVYFSGMGRSPYYLLYLLLCMDSGLYLGRRGSVFVAVLCGVEYLAAIFVAPHAYGSAEASSYVLIVAPFFLFVALYGGGLAIAEREQRDRARRDGLTGLYNHAAFQEDLRKQFEDDRAAASPVSCVLFDVDRFKSVNDTYGHLFGNRVLREIALRVPEALRGGDRFYRYGGEEFALILLCRAEEAHRVAERVRARVADLDVANEGERVSLTISAGLSERFAEDGEDQSLMVHRADVSLYAAKRGGRNRAEPWRRELEGAGG